MPQIREFTATRADQGFGQLFRPSDAGAAALAQEARRTGSLMRESGQMEREAGRMLGSTFGGLGKEIADQAEQFVTHKEEMKFHGAEPDFMLGAVTSWKDYATKNDITDPAVVKDFNDSLRDGEDQFVGSFGTERGREMAADAVQRRRGELYRMQTADTGNRLGELGHQAILDNANKFSAMVMQDPTSLGLAMDSLDNLGKTLKGQNVTEQMRGQYDNLVKTMKSGVAHSAFLSMAEQDPQGAKDLLKNGWQSDVLSGGERVTLSNMADTLAEKQKRDARDVAQQAKIEETQATNSDINNLYSRAFDPATMSWNIPVLSQGMMDVVKQHPTESTGLARSVFDMVERVSQERDRKAALGATDAQTYDDFKERMFLPPEDKRALSYEDIYRARADGKLSDHDMNFFHGALTAATKDPQKREALKRFNTVMNSFKSSITHSNPLMQQSDPWGDQQWGKFQSDMHERFEQAYAKGDWQGLIQSGNDAYIGNTLKNYAYPMRQSINDLTKKINDAGGLAPAPVPQKPGEKPEDYLKRLRGGG